MDRRAVRSAITRSFKTNGLYLKSAAVQLLEQALLGSDANLDRQQVFRAVAMVADEVQAQPLDSNLVSEQVMETVLSKWQEKATTTSASDLTMDKVVQAIDSFKEVPRYTYRADRKQFLPAGASALHPTAASAKAAVFRDRLVMLRQRTMRNELFMPALEGVSDTERRFQLTPLSALLGAAGDSHDRSTANDSIVVMGMLSQLQEGKFYLEDLDGKLRVDLSQTEFTMGLFTEQTVVISEGVYKDQLFHATSIGFPPPELRTKTLRAHSALNFFGGEAVSVERREMVEEFEVQNEEAMFIVISDVWLDKPAVLAKLRKLFEGFEGMGKNVVFVLMGNFLSEPHGAAAHKVLTDSLNDLTNLISDFDDLRNNATFLMVPGPRDVGGSSILPRRSLPGYCTERMRARIPHANFTSNPARVRYCTQELVFFREDIVNKMRRNCIVVPGASDDADPDTADISQQVVKTLIDQGTVSPLPVHVSPVYWEYDHALHLYPTPDVLVLADKFDAYNVEYNACTCFNPGSFFSSDWNFMVYTPSKARIDPEESEDHRAAFDSRVEFSQIK